jgi:hypothetical protein
MGHAERRAVFLEVARTLPSLVSGIDDFARPALGSWTVADLTEHLLRALRTPLTYLGRPTPDPGLPVLSGPSSYFLAAMARRSTDPEAADQAIEARGRMELDGIDPSRYGAIYSDAVGQLEEKLGGDYLPSRTLEATIHGMDLARATESAWIVPARAFHATLRLFSDLALETGRGEDLVMALPGRDDRDVLPLLR